MPVLVGVLEFVAACLLVGFGVFLVAEESRRLQGRPVITATRDAVAVIGGLLVAAAAGIYWLSMAIP